MEEEVMGNPANKKRSDGKLTGGKAAQGAAKAYKATGKVPSRNMEVGGGTKNLAMRRLWRMLFGEDE
jgi:hypothetical protein